MGMPYCASTQASAIVPPLAQQDRMPRGDMRGSQTLKTQSAEVRNYLTFNQLAITLGGLGRD